jgi:hypothetical protein
MVATLLRGGRFSKFEDKYKWLILPRMRLQPDSLVGFGSGKTDFENDFGTNELMDALYPQSEPDNHLNLRQE